jgi:hypothetical protein
MASSLQLCAAAVGQGHIPDGFPDRLVALNAIILVVFVSYARTASSTVVTY